MASNRNRPSVLASFSRAVFANSRWAIRVSRPKDEIVFPSRLEGDHEPLEMVKTGKRGVNHKLGDLHDFSNLSAFADYTTFAVSHLSQSGRSIPLVPRKKGLVFSFFFATSSPWSPSCSRECDPPNGIPEEVIRG